MHELRQEKHMNYLWVILLTNVKEHSVQYPIAFNTLSKCDNKSKGGKLCHPNIDAFFWLIQEMI